VLISVVLIFARVGLSPVRSPALARCSE